MTFAEEEIVALRRTLHAQPEIGLDLPQTQRTLIDALSALKLETTLGTRLSSITGVLRGGKPGPTVLLRSDMDALPIAEATGLPFASVNGAMHACGHDMHMAGLVGAARILAERRAELPGNVVFMFQPGEEGFAGGRIMIEEGVLDAAGERPVAAYAMHVDCGTESGLFLTRPGPIMSSASGLKLLVNGKGGHAALPHLLIDPVPVAAEIVLAFQSFVARRVPVGDPAVVSVTRLHTNSGAGNVVPSTVAIEANIRTLSRETLKLVREELPRLARALGEAHGCTVDAEFIDSYPVTHNDPSETAAVLDQLGDRAQLLPHPGMASEDFAYVLEEVPGTLVFVGARPAGVDPHDQPAMHSALATFDDGVLGVQAATLAELAWRRLHQAA